jgi:hypothetical protein
MKNHSFLKTLEIFDGIKNKGNESWMGYDVWKNWVCWALMCKRLKIWRVVKQMLMLGCWLREKSDQIDKNSDNPIKCVRCE